MDGGSQTCGSLLRLLPSPAARAGSYASLGGMMFSIGLPRSSLIPSMSCVRRPGSSSTAHGGRGADLRDSQTLSEGENTVLQGGKTLMRSSPWWPAASSSGRRAYRRHVRLLRGKKQLLLPSENWPRSPKPTTTPSSPLHVSPFRLQASELRTDLRTPHPLVRCVVCELLLAAGTEQSRCVKESTSDGRGEVRQLLACARSPIACDCEFATGRLRSVEHAPRKLVLLCRSCGNVRYEKRHESMRDCSLYCENSA